MYISLLPLPLLLLLLPPTKVEAKSKRGIFLHLTDLHPDPQYLYNSLESDYCHPQTQSITTSHSTLGFANEEDKLNSGSFNFSSYERDESSRGSSSRSSRRAGYFGLPSSECDTPLSLLDSTFNFISKHFSTTNSPTSSSSSASPSTTVFDLIILTGDSARHDLDPLNYPRTLKEISNLNRFVSEKLRKSFGDEKQVTVGVTIGNNDVFPHNVAFPGPNKVTTSLLDLWMEKGFIPEEMKRTFLRGGYYSFEVIENELLLISLNSIYFFEKNSVVEGCPPVQDDVLSAWKEGSTSMMTEEIDPGSEQLLWFEQQLELAKLKGMKVWIIGHVPPEESNWYKGCLEQYSELVIKHGQNVLGQFFGHMNQDHFSFLTLPPSTTTTTNSSSTNPPPSSSLNSSPISTLDSSQLPISTLDSSQLPSILYKHFKQTLSTLSASSDENLNEEELLSFSSFQVSPSLIPTYLPTFRIYEYNTIDNHDNPSTLTTTTQSFKSIFSSSSLLSFFSPDHHRKNANKRFPPKYIPLSYTQFYIPLSSLERSNKLYDDLLYNTSSNNITKGSREWEKRLREIEPSWEIEYTTLPRREVIDRLLSLLLSSSSVVGSTRSSLSERSSGEEDKEAEEELVIKKEFMPREIKDFLTSVSSSSSSPRKWRSTRRKLEILLEKYDLVPFEISTQGKEGGLSNSNWLRLAKRLVDSRDQLKKKKHKKNKNKKGKGGGRDGKMWKKWVERMGVRTGEL